MIYADHAATSYPKHPEVLAAHRRSAVCYGANPGRGGYPMSLAASEQLYLCRERAAAFLGLSDARRVVLMPNCTTALNTVIQSLLRSGGRAVISDLEHNAVVRPLHALSPSYPCYDVAHVSPEDGDATVEAFRRAINSKTKAIICTHASNVTGCVLPVARLATLAHEHGIPIVVDAAQSAGHVPLHVEREGIDYLCTAGHKGLGGTMGTGLLLCAREDALTPLVYGGTGSFSLSPEQPETLPDRLESGTPNVSGVCALRAGIEHLLAIGIERVASYEHTLYTMLYNGLRTIERVRMYSPSPERGTMTPVLSLTVDGMDVQQTAEQLTRYGIACRAGLHCAPLAHKTIGTLPTGTVRLSLGMTNTVAQVETTVKLFKKIR